MPTTGDQVGASPKWVIRRNRLQEVASRLEHGQSVKLARLAAELGYADQAHLTRDFKSATGKTPSEFARRVGGSQVGKTAPKPRRRR